jgi:hypothetical protein
VDVDVEVDAGVLLTAARALAVRLTVVPLLPPTLLPPPLPLLLPAPLPLPATLGAGAVGVADAAFEAGAAAREDEGGGGT